MRIFHTYTYIRKVEAHISFVNLIKRKVEVHIPFVGSHLITNIIFREKNRMVEMQLLWDGGIIQIGEGNNSK